ncbi:MAG: DNA polymerase III subunit delta [Gammaproteobacteria bacterium]|nr:DNA polymerase III subunit delta [Gammaproteobacteria bacterium]
MRIKGEELAVHLKPLRPLYLVAGDEPFLVGEAVEQIAAAAQAAGFTERRRFMLESGFSWAAFREELGSLSLFASRTFYELRADSREGLARELKATLPVLGADTLLVVTTPALDRAAQQTEWVEAAAASGHVVSVSAPEGGAFVAWVRTRAAAAGIHDPEVATAVAYYTEGNIGAAWQAIQRLALVPNADVAAAEGILSDESRFDVFAVTDCALKGDVRGVDRCARRLQTEGRDPILMTWALARELRLLARAGALRNPRALQDLWRRERVWPARQTLLTGALQRTTRAELVALLRQCALLDRVNKGRAIGDAWLMTRRIALRLAGVRLALHSEGNEGDEYGG